MELNDESTAAIARLHREDWGRIVAALIRILGDFDLAEDAAQDAFSAAVEQWPVSGIPKFPRAWIIQTGRNKAIDRLRRRTRFEEQHEAYAAMQQLQPPRQRSQLESAAVHAPARQRHSLPELPSPEGIEKGARIMLVRRVPVRPVCARHR